MTPINIYNDSANMIRRVAIKNNLSVEKVVESLVNVIEEAGLELPTENKDISSANAEYTGGGVYIYWGKLGENYFLINHVCETLAFGLILDVCPDLSDDETLMPEWQEAHTVKELTENELNQFIVDVLDWIITNRPSGNYDMIELECRLNDLLEEMC